MNTVVVVGSINMDVMARVARMPRPAETVPGSSVALLPGGKGANQAVAARRAGGCPVRLVGAVDDDACARGVRSFQDDQDVDVCAVASVTGPSPTALVTVDAQGATTVVMQNEIPEAANRAAIETARSAGATTVLNLAPY